MLNRLVLVVVGMHTDGISTWDSHTHTDRQTDRHTDIRTCKAASSQLKN